MLDEHMSCASVYWRDAKEFAKFVTWNRHQQDAVQRVQMHSQPPMPSYSGPLTLVIVIGASASVTRLQSDPTCWSDCQTIVGLSNQRVSTMAIALSNMLDYATSATQVRLFITTLWVKRGWFHPVAPSDEALAALAASAARM